MHITWWKRSHCSYHSLLHTPIHVMSKPNLLTNIRHWDVIYNVPILSHQKEAPVLRHLLVFRTKMTPLDSVRSKYLSSMTKLPKSSSCTMTVQRVKQCVECVWKPYKLNQKMRSLPLLASEHACSDMTGPPLRLYVIGSARHPLRYQTYLCAKFTDSYNKQIAVSLDKNFPSKHNYPFWAITAKWIISVCQPLPS